MQTKRAYLVAKGLAKPGRGKFSNAAKAELAKAESKGIKFADAVPARSKATVSRPEKPPEPPSPSESPYLYPSDFRFPEKEYEAVGPDGRVYGMRECCNTCMASLTNHGCDAPTIHDNVPVHIREVR